MLVLARRVDQTIVFPKQGIVVTVLDANARTVKLGVEASRDVSVLRGELMPEGVEGKDDAKSSQIPALFHETKANSLQRSDVVARLSQCQALLQQGMIGSATDQITRLLTELQGKPVGNATPSESRDMGSWKTSITVAESHANYSLGVDPALPLSASGSSPSHVVTDYFTCV